MAERASLLQVVQIGVETDYGVPVAATKRMTAMSIAAGLAGSVKKFRPMGFKYPTLTANDQEWSTADITGVPTFTELVYPLSSVLTTPVITTVMDGASPTPGRSWIWSPSSTGEDNPKTFTVEMGSAVRAHRFAHGLVTEIGMTFSRTGAELSGSMLGTRLEDGIALTAGPTSVELVPITGDAIDVYMDEDSGDLGTTKLARAISAELAVGSRYGPVWVIDSAKESWAAFVETEPDARLSLVHQADADGMAMLNNLRNEDTRFFRVQAKGPRIYTGGSNVDYLFQWDTAGKVDDFGSFSDEDGVYAIGWTWRTVHDDDWGKALQVKLINKLAAL